MTRTYSDEVGPFYTMDTVMEEAQRCLLCLDDHVLRNVLQEPILQNLSGACVSAI